MAKLTRGRHVLCYYKSGPEVVARFRLMSKILLVDDDRQLCQSLSDYLESEVHVVDLAHDAQEANHR